VVWIIIKPVVNISSENKGTGNVSRTRQTEGGIGRRIRHGGGRGNASAKKRIERRADMHDGGNESVKKFPENPEGRGWKGKNPKKRKF